MSETEAVESCGNVFADLDLPDAEELSRESNLIIDIKRRVRGIGLSRAEATRVLGITLSDWGRLCQGRTLGTGEFPKERLERMLAALHQPEALAAPRGVSHGIATSLSAEAKS